MAVVLLTIAQIRECVLKLVKSAKVKIPEFPKETWNIEHHYVSELFESGGEIVKKCLETFEDLLYDSVDYGLADD